MTASGGYEMWADQGRKLLYLKPWGIPGEEQLAAFYDQVARLSRSLAPGPWSLLANLTEAVPNAGMDARYKEAMVTTRSLGCTREAVVIALAAVEMQTRRLKRQIDDGTGGPAYRVFGSVDEALAWLELDALV